MLFAAVSVIAITARLRHSELHIYIYIIYIKITILYIYKYNIRRYTGHKDMASRSFNFAAAQNVEY